MSYGVRSDKTTYDIDVYSDRHNVVVKDKNNEGNRETTYTYTEGQSVVIFAAEPDDSFITGWTAELLKENGRPASGTATDLNLKSSNCVVTFDMPVSGGSDVPLGYSIELTAIYAKKIMSLTAEPSFVPTAGQDLPDEMNISFSNGTNGTYPVTWTYKHDSKEIITSGEAYNNTVYTATVRVGRDIADEIFLASSVGLSATEGEVKSQVTHPNPADGSVAFSISFPCYGNGRSGQPGTRV